MNQIRYNYQKVLDMKLKQIKQEGKTPRLLLHACCAPCSSYVLEYLSEYFIIDVYYYNPNISSEDEYKYRAYELVRFVKEKEFSNPVNVFIEKYNPEEFYQVTHGLEECKEGGKRCFECYKLRLEQTAERALSGGYDYFTTTLSISPLKNAQKLNEIGAELQHDYGVHYLYSDFKKKDGYKRSIELSKEFNLYRQHYCGCIFSKRNTEVCKIK
ncbi:MAG: epoxyqueuosine reductase QueH [Eubacterium sp.]|nr:epoxyqueuosine reductase QueH [Eubacterium sp.]